MIDIADVKTLSLKPGQVLVVQVDRPVSMEMRSWIADEFVKVQPDLAERLLVIDPGISLAVIDQIA